MFGFTELPAGFTTLELKKAPPTSAPPTAQRPNPYRACKSEEEKKIRIPKNLKDEREKNISKNRIH